MNTLRYQEMLQKQLLFVFLLLSYVAVAQQNDSTPQTIQLSGDISVTNNGISLIPSFSLGKPALTFDLAARGERFSFNPQLRFGVEGFKPWGFSFISQYKLIKTNKTVLSVGTHFPGLMFRTDTIVNNGTTMDQTVVQRYLPFDFYWGYSLSEKVNLGIYSLYGIGLNKFDPTQSRHNNFLSLQANINHIRLNKVMYLKWDPQVYFLRTGQQNGFFVASLLTLASEKIPFSLSCMVNQTIKTEIPVKNLDWNISLTYSFRNELVKK